MTAVVADPDKLIARFVRPDMHLHFASTTAKPNALAFALARTFAGQRSLTLSMSAVHSAIHALALSGAVRKVITCFMGHTYPTPRPSVIYRNVADGDPFEVEQWSVLSFMQRLVAGAMALPYAVTSSLSGSDLVIGKEGVLFETNDPAADHGTVLMAAALRPDLTLLHGVCADSRGNIVLMPPLGEGPWSAYAAREGVLATVERIVPDSVVDEHPELVVIPGQRVIALCEVPWGAHPQAVPTGDFQGIAGYRDDYDFLAELASSTQTMEDAQRWYREWVTDVGRHTGYLAKIGAGRLEQLRLAPRTAAHPDTRPDEAQPTFGGAATVAPAGDPVADSAPAAPVATASVVERLAETAADDTPGPARVCSTQEKTILLASRAIQDRVLKQGYDTVLAGVGTSHIAAWLAAARLRELGIDIKICAELGFYGQRPQSGDVFLFSQLHSAEQLSGVLETLGGMMSGNRGRCLGVLGTGEIDPLGNINTSIAANGAWMTGSGGANDIASSCECVVVAAASPRRYVDQVAFITSPGTNVREVVCQFGRFRRPDAHEKFRLATWLPLLREYGTPEEAVHGLTQWPAMHEDECESEAEITDAELAALHALDPQGLYR